MQRRKTNLGRITRGARRLKLKRAKETPEERIERRKKSKEQNAHRRSKETPEEKAERLKIYRKRAIQMRKIQQEKIDRQRRLEVFSRICGGKNAESTGKTSKQKEEKSISDKTSKQKEEKSINDNLDEISSQNNDSDEENENVLFPTVTITVEEECEQQ